MVMVVNHKSGRGSLKLDMGDGEGGGGGRKERKVTRRIVVYLFQNIKTWAFITNCLFHVTSTQTYKII